MSLVFRKLLPREVARFGKGAHLLVLHRKSSFTWQEAAVKKCGVGFVGAWFELRHIDVMLADERLDLPRTEPRVLICSNEPVHGWRRRDPLHNGSMRFALIGGRTVVHKFVEELVGLAIKNPQWPWFAHGTFARFMVRLTGCKIRPALHKCGLLPRGSRRNRPASVNKMA